MRKKAIIRQKSLLPPLCEKKAERGVGLSMMCYTLGKEERTCLGERQLRGRMGK